MGIAVVGMVGFSVGFGGRFVGVPTVIAPLIASCIRVSRCPTRIAPDALPTPPADALRITGVLVHDKAPARKRV